MYTFEDLKLFYIDNQIVSEQLIREEKKDPEINNETCNDLCGLLFRIKWYETPEGREYWFNLYRSLKKSEEDGKHT